MKKMLWNENWIFQYEDIYGKSKDIFDNNIVDLPHDFSIYLPRNKMSRAGASGGFFEGGTGTYIKTFYYGSEDKEYMLVVEGAYMIAEVFINGDLVMQHPNGYTEFKVRMTPWLKHGENQIKIVVMNDAMPNSRWYTGSGLYRNIWLMSGSKVSLCEENMQIITSSLDSQRVLLVVKNHIDDWRDDCSVDLNLEIHTNIINPSKEKVAHDVLTCFYNIKDYSWQFEVKQPQLWDVNFPNLYRIKQELYVDGELWDEVELNFGIRTIEVSVDKGLLINGITTKLKGGCIHHDNGPLGACVYKDAEYRKIKLLKSAGYNAIRTAHNPPSRDILNACDELGMMVMDEIYDCWRLKKCKYDYHLFFENWWKDDVKSIVERDRNHPSVIMWSTGNEIGERGGKSDGNKYAAELANEFRRYDMTRPITNGICAVFLENGEFGGIMGNVFNGSAGDINEIEMEFPGIGSAYMDVMERFEALTEGFCESLDLVGYNYLDSHYEKDHVLFPERIFCGTESYPRLMAENWNKVKQLDYVIGDFTWTAFDYFGESGIGRAVYGEDKLSGLLGEYPWHIAGCGDFDLCGHIKPQGEYRRRVFEETRHIYIAVSNPQNTGKKEIISPWGWPERHNSWTFPGFEGTMVTVEVYGISGDVELLLNGKNFGKKSIGDGKLNLASFNIPYMPGIIEAILYEDGGEKERTSLQTASSPMRLDLVAEEVYPHRSLYYLWCNVEDKDGMEVPYAEPEIKVHVQGDGVLLGIGTGNPVSEELYVTDHRKAYEGKLLVVVKRTGQGEIEVIASSLGMIGAMLRI